MVFGVALVAFGLLMRQRSATDPERRRWVVATALSAALAFLLFLLATPYLVLDWRAALAGIRNEARTSHLGADGLSPLGNFVWYLTAALPDALTWPQMLVLAIGVVAAALRRKGRVLVLTGWALLFLAAISLPALHWNRWALPIVPCLTLLAAHGVDTLARLLVLRLPAARVGAPQLFALGLVALLL